MLSKFKYLENILDSKLNWNGHFDQRLNKATQVLRKCRRVYGLRWGLKMGVVNWFYTTVIRPMISYAALVWCPKIGQISE